MENKLLELKNILMRYKRIKESEALGEEFKYLKINEEGFLEKPYPVPGTLSVTYDKVAAASFIKGMQNMDECEDDSLGYAPYYEGRNEIYKTAGRIPVYTKKEILEEKRNKRIR